MKDKDFNSSINGMGWKVEHAFKEMVEVIEEANKRIQELEQKVKDALNIKKFQPYKDYQYKTLKTWKTANTWYEKDGPIYTIEQLEELRKTDLLIAAENKAISEQNKASHKAANDYLMGLGLKETKYVYKSSRSYNKKQVRCEWISEIAALFPSCPLESDVNSYYDKEIKRINDHFKKIADEKEAQERAAAQDKKVKERDAFLIRLSDKYNLGFEGVPTAEDVLYQLINKDKYLALAHYLLKNREDWNDGPSYAKRGLIHFSVETPEEQKIYDELWERCEDWQGDGRCFRDSQVGYDAMFAIAAERNQELYNDFMKVRDYAS